MRAGRNSKKPFMRIPRNYQTQAVIIKQIKFSEVDKILIIYTPEFGKLKAIAKGAYRPRSKLGGNVEPLTHSSMMLARGRNFDIVTQSQTIDGFMALKNDLWHTSCGLYIVDLIDSFTAENDKNPPLFNLLIDALHHLCQTDDSETILRYFELHFLHHLGYQPQLQQCVACNSPLIPVVNFFSFSQGGVLCPNCSNKEAAPYPLSVDALKILRLWQNSDYATARRVKIKPKLSSQLRQLMQNYIKHLLQREVKSMIWLQKLRES